LVEDSEQNRADIAATFAAQLEHVYEAFVAETQDNVSETRIRPALKSREERIAEQRKKRAEEAQVRVIIEVTLNVFKFCSCSFSVMRLSRDWLLFQS